MLTHEHDTYRLVGLINQDRIDLTIAPSKTLHGRLGEHPVNLVLIGDTASGDVRGYPCAFEVFPIEGGFLIGGKLPGHTVRVELTQKSLRWYPGCEKELKPAAAPGVFTGTCVENRQATVTLPPALIAMPRLPRLILLAILLTERDPVFDLQEPRLFAPLRPEPRQTNAAAPSRF